MIHVRAYEAADRMFVLSLAPRLLIGMPPWRDPQLWLTAFQNWMTVSIDQHGQATMVFVAENDHGEGLGFATLSHATHFTGEHHAYINELVTATWPKDAALAPPLIQACEQWAREQGYRILALSTGAANARALGFYHHLGFHDEDVKLVKLLTESGSDNPNRQP
jgi:GNAT superfamily N-acetyltransferase